MIIVEKILYYLLERRELLFWEDSRVVTSKKETSAAAVLTQLQQLFLLLPTSTWTSPENTRLPAESNIKKTKRNYENYYNVPRLMHFHGTPYARNRGVTLLTGSSSPQSQSNSRPSPMVGHEWVPVDTYSLRPCEKAAILISSWGSIQAARDSMLILPRALSLKAKNHFPTASQDLSQWKAMSSMSHPHLIKWNIPERARPLVGLAYDRPWGWKPPPLAHAGSRDDRCGPPLLSVPMCEQEMGRVDRVSNSTLMVYYYIVRARPLVICTKKDPPPVPRRCDHPFLSPRCHPSIKTPP